VESACQSADLADGTEDVMTEVRKMAHIVLMSQELIDQYANQEPLMESIKRAPERRRKRLEDEITYGAQLNPCIELGGADA